MSEWETSRYNFEEMESAYKKLRDAFNVAKVEKDRKELEGIAREITELSQRVGEAVTHPDLFDLEGHSQADIVKFMRGLSQLQLQLKNLLS